MNNHPTRIPATSDASSGREPGRTSVLVVDDSFVDRRLAGSILGRDAGLDVTYASNGIEALEEVERQRPDVVVTDLQMPEMNGLILVEKVREKYPLIPIILMTAHGSEEIAIQALRRGAASYVPKRLLVRELAATVKDVLAMARSDRQQQRLHECWNQTEFYFCLDNDASLIPLLVNHIQHYLLWIRHCDESELVRVGIALQEALRNAIHHGNLELQSALREDDSDAYYLLAERRRLEAPFRDRRVYIMARESPTEARYVIRDEGPGFDPTPYLAHNPTDPVHLERHSGRGLFLMRMFMHEITYSEQGNELTMIHRRDGAPAEACGGQFPAAEMMGTAD